MSLDQLRRFLKEMQNDESLKKEVLSNAHIRGLRGINEAYP